MQVVGLLVSWAVLPRQGPEYVLVIDSGSTGTRMCARGALWRRKAWCSELSKLPVDLCANEPSAYHSAEVVAPPERGKQKCIPMLGREVALLGGDRYAYAWRERAGRLPLVQAVSINAARHKGA